MLLFIISIELLTRKILTSINFKRISLDKATLKKLVILLMTWLFLLPIPLPFPRFLRYWINFLSYLVLKSTMTRPLLSQILLIFFPLFNQFFPKKKLFNPLKFLGFFSLLKPKIWCKIGMLFFAGYPILLFSFLTQMTPFSEKQFLSTNTF